MKGKHRHDEWRGGDSVTKERAREGESYRVRQIVILIKILFN